MIAGKNIHALPKAYTLTHTHTHTHRSGASDDGHNGEETPPLDRLLLHCAVLLSPPCAAHRTYTSTHTLSPAPRLTRALLPPVPRAEAMSREPNGTMILQRRWPPKRQHHSTMCLRPKPHPHPNPHPRSQPTSRCSPLAAAVQVLFSQVSVGCQKKKACRMSSCFKRGLKDRLCIQIVVHNTVIPYETDMSPHLRRQTAPKSTKLQRRVARRERAGSRCVERAPVPRPVDPLCEHLPVLARVREAVCAGQTSACPLLRREWSRDRKLRSEAPAVVDACRRRPGRRWGGGTGWRGGEVVAISQPWIPHLHT